MSRLLLVRHGNTTLDSGVRFWGRTDVRLSDTGIRQAEQLRDRLAMEKIDLAYSSKLSRALLTAEIIAAPHQVTVTTCDELIEIDFGMLEGLTFAEISQLYPEHAQALADRCIPPRFPGGESIEELNQRVNKFIGRLPQNTTDETVLIVAHSGVLRLLVCNLLGIGLRHWRQIRIDLASLSILETYPQYALLTRINDVSHLQP